VLLQVSTEPEGRAGEPHVSARRYRPTQPPARDRARRREPLPIRPPRAGGLAALTWFGGGVLLRSTHGDLDIGTST